MKLDNKLKMLVILLLTLFFTNKYYEIYRLFCFFIPLYICFLYIELKPYYSVYSIVRFQQQIEWHKKLISIIIEYTYIGAIILCIDKLIITNNYNNIVEICSIFLVYFLFLSISGMILILPNLSVIRSSIFFIVFFVFARSNIKIFDFLQTLYDSRKWSMGHGIIKTIVIFIVINVLIYSLYFIFIKIRTEIMSFYEN
ncbi:hypothetical protein CLTEP_24220 [Clostridium tepidiprofundi DSM 19306]|uniref:Uncharacterized protein n=1 Tax=Clostridium tepidiprofundi DSM 19306 TaxID=1121338 RepID=A0A151AUA5_9CLOT|nr:hypothetical protein [Clostridium tepidiprofundi]KYH31143.1 hypothetical protein CLTEP_24220 [Clostridium tepidiprofundi DSM 19306]